MPEEMHRIAFEDRLGRVRSNLHLVLSDMETISSRCSDPNTRPERVVPRLESAVSVLRGSFARSIDHTGYARTENLLLAVVDQWYTVGPLTIPGGCQFSDIMVDLDIGGTWIGDLIV